MGLEISHRLHVTSGALDRTATLPELPGASEYQVPMLDRMGEQLQSSWPIVAAGSIAGGVIGSKLLRIGGGGIFRGVVGGIAGVLGGASALIGGRSLLRGNDAHRAPSPAPASNVASTQVGERERVKVMTWNVHGGMGGPGKFGSSDAELDRLAEAVRREQPDVLLLQEVDRFATRSNYTDTLAQLDARLDPDSSVGAGATTAVSGREQHTAIMTFNGFSVSDARNIVHQDPRGGGIGTRLKAARNQAESIIDGVFGTEWSDGNDSIQGRNTIEALVRTPGGSDVRVLNGHYQWPDRRHDHQKLQVGALAGALDAWSGPTIWGGDFNVRDGSAHGERERTLLASAGLHDTLAGTAQHERITMTDHTTDPNDVKSAAGGIDRIYASEHARVVQTRVARDAGDASDHLPLVTELELN